MLTIFIVAFAPSKNSPNGVGGFDWFYKRHQAVSAMTAHLPDEGYDYRFIEVQVPADTRDITEWVEKNVELP